MLPRHSRPARIAVLTAVVALLALSPAAGRAAAGASVVGPKTYYLALGDSLAYGLQPDFVDNQGYPQDFFANLQAHGTTTLVNLGCTGETTVTFINGGCIYRTIFPPHDSYSGSQLAAALAFIQQHPGQVSPVTVDIGANDLLPAINAQTCLTTNLTATVQTIAVNLHSILSQLHTALNGTGDLITMNYYSPYQNSCPNLIPLTRYLNGLLAGLATHDGALVAPVFLAFGGGAFPNYALCLSTWTCLTTTYPTCKIDAHLCIHPTTLGYKVIAGTIEATVGY